MGQGGVPCPKGPKRATRKRKRDEAQNENTAEVWQTVMDRDQHRCRVPWCHEFQRDDRTMDSSILDMAHLEDKGMGGDHGRRTRTDNCVACCRAHHKGRRSLHSGHLKYRFLTDRGANGPMVWEQHEDIGRFRPFAELLDRAGV